MTDEYDGAEARPDWQALLPLGATPSTAIEVAGTLANEYARANLLERYWQELTAQTRRRQQADIALFARYLGEVEQSLRTTAPGPRTRAEEVRAATLATDLTTWAPVTYGLVVGFQEWQKRQGYAIGSINVRMSTIRAYCRLAMQARVLAPEEYMAIASIHKIKPKAARNIDEQRVQQQIPTRIGRKKAAPHVLPPQLSRQLKDHLRVADDPLAPRDLLLVCLLADMGLRCGEVAALPANCFNLPQRTMTFYRHKTHKTQTHWLTTETREAARAFLAQDQPSTPDGRRFLFQGDPRAPTVAIDGHVRPGKSHDGYDDTSINARIRVLGQRYLGIADLSPHDLRHSWATEQGKKKNLPALQQAGGWSSLQMPLHYIQAQTIANDGLVNPEADDHT